MYEPRYRAFKGSLKIIKLKEVNDKLDYLVGETIDGDGEVYARDQAQSSRVELVSSLISKGNALLDVSGDCVLVDCMNVVQVKGDKITITPTKVVAQQKLAIKDYVSSHLMKNDTKRIIQELIKLL